MINNLNTLADRLKGVTINGKEISAEELINQIKSDEEVEISVNKFNLLSDAEIDELKQTVEVDSKNTGFVDGMKSGVEQTVKAIRNRKGLELEGKIKMNELGKIDFDATAEMITIPYDEKILKDAKIEPNKQISKLQAQIEENKEALTKVQKTYETEKSQWEESEKNRVAQLEKEKASNFMFQKMPESSFLTKKQQLTLFTADGYGVKFNDDGSDYPTKNGQPIKDKMEKNRQLQDVLNEYASKNKWIKNGEGRSVGDENPATKKQFKTKFEAFKYLETNNINPGSKEGKELLEKVEQD